MKNNDGVKMKMIVVSSGKGGVGKSTVSIMTAYALKSMGYDVGLLDIDIDTPNLAEFIGERPSYVVDDMVNPIIVDDIEMASVSFMVNDSDCVTWNGENRVRMIDDMMSGIRWSCDVLVVDTPPGTSEEMSHIITKYQPDGVLIITTPHESSITDVRRTVTLMKMLKANIIGAVINMDGYACPHCGEISKMFDNDLTSVDIQATLGIPVIASIPYEPERVGHTNTNVHSEAYADAIIAIGSSIEEVI